MSNISYGNTTTKYFCEDGSVLKVKEILQEHKVIRTMIEHEERIHTDKDSLFKDIIDAMKDFTNGDTRKITLEIKVDAEEKICILKSWRPKK